jgi:hypothetical protein
VFCTSETPPLCERSGTKSIVHSLFEHDNEFYHVREGDLFKALPNSSKAVSKEFLNGQDRELWIPVLRAFGVSAGNGDSSGAPVRAGAPPRIRLWLSILS